MNRRDIYKAWGRVLAGHVPSLSIEITKECPLQCPGCYASLTFFQRFGNASRGQGEPAPFSQQLPPSCFALFCTG